eukprot:CAMPEP_0196571324 /NCGR_PEP_ID=MMETSP1081-20130531/1504_1 /TAXON_ID=36882 /ORGANISM="Pyramimonas amylifera, Strain CCMP720" /LENGTH=153 /DNA_ID=CAMNT_0041888219 /DNA_START=103 /DNA_END=564 /DNA_ORIENTATION=-
MLEMIATAREKEVVTVQKAFNLLCKNQVHDARVQPGSVKYAGLVSEEDQSSVLYWVLNAPPPQRREFLLLLNQMVGASAGIEAATSKRRRMSSVLRSKSIIVDSHRIDALWAESKGSQQEDTRPFKLVNVSGGSHSSRDQEEDQGEIQEEYDI